MLRRQIRLDAFRTLGGNAVGAPIAAHFGAHRHASSTARGSSPAAAVNVTGAGPSASTAPSIPQDAPILSFLAHKNILLDSIDGTIDTTNNVLALLEKNPTPQETHDIIDTASNILCLFLDPCEFVRQIHPDNDYKSAALQGFSKVHSYMCEINSRRDLYEHLARLATPEAQKVLGDEECKNVAQLKRDMESNGIHLPDKLRKTISEMNIEKEELAMRFIAEQNSKNPYGVLRNLLKCRYDQARLLGYESCSQQLLHGTMLESPEKVWHFLCGVANKYRPEADKEVAMLRAHQGEVRGRQMLTDEDRAKISISLRSAKEIEGLEQYFSVANCVRGIQCLCSEVFGVKLITAPFEPEEVLHADAKKFHVFDEKNEFLGVIVLDMFARSTKHCQAGHLTVQLGCRPHLDICSKVGLAMPARQYPIVVLTCNAGSNVRASKRADGTLDDEATLMQPHEVTTCFHEFGHAMHTIFGQTKVQNLAGTRASIDYVELFSQFFEQFLTSHEFLKLWAHRIGTGEPIPKEMVQRRNEAADMFKHLDTLDQVVLAAIDQSLHGPQPFTVYFPYGGSGHLGKRTLSTMDEYGRGIFNFAKTVIDIATPLSAVTPTERGVLRSLSFEHLSSYPAGYYGYLYSGAFAKRIWSKFFAANPLNREEGRRLRNELMAYGAACNTREVLAKYLREDIDDIEAWV